MDKITNLAKQLEPFLLRQVETYVQGVIGSGSAVPSVGNGSGGVSTHDLDGQWHSGTLANEQAPQFLLTNGQRKLTGHMPVDAGVTIDGVDLSVLKSDFDSHKIDPEAHPQYAKPADDEVITGQWDFLNDLNVGTTLYVDYSGDRVGIREPADAQFALDVTGNLRAKGWIVGKHAIQIEDARHIFHFDGRQARDNTDFTGTLTSHKGLNPRDHDTVKDNIIFGEGKFGKGLTQFATQTNYFADPIFAYTGSVLYGQGGTGTITKASGIGLFGDNAIEIVTSGSAWIYPNYVPVANGQSITASAYFKKFETDGYFQVGLYNLGTGSYEVLELKQDSPVGEWYRHSATWTNNTGATVNVRTYLIVYKAGAAAGTYHIDGIQATLTDYLSPFFYGDMPGCSWASTAHASNSVYTMSPIRYDPWEAGKNVGPSTIMGWIKIEDYAATYQYAWRQNGTDGGGTLAYCILRVNDVGTWGYYFSAAGANIAGPETIEPGKWYHAAIVRDPQNSYGEGSAKQYLYIDGVRIHSAGLTNFVPDTNGLWVGSYSTTAANATVDELAIIDRALTADEIRAIYESNAPVFAETSTFSWSDPKNTIWVDEEGLYGKDQTGKDILAISTVDGKSWSGKTLDAGDFMLGSATLGDYLFYDLSAGELTMAGASGVLTIDGNGFGVDAQNGAVSYPANWATVDQKYGLKFFQGSTVIGGLRSQYVSGSYVELDLVTKAIASSTDAIVSLSSTQYGTNLTKAELTVQAGLSGISPKVGLWINGTSRLSVDSSYIRATLNMAFTTSGGGPILRDISNGNYYQLRMNNGNLTFINLGTTL